ncbi:magnesium and cobalt transport protein CorA [Labilibaculum filiforme]|uniref:Magnesium transport protein CorA n=1 Tax=Labilibaculum filiforme TaxID=1940526 RepID=A0A2N3HYF9_9BACT|nr:magnesium/cobalt transporter CorA [Labilibaculum filiforme]PKQ63067.1 magnesium and cobalt transport protein CorA [Labilibaculum filiforme]
MATKKSSRITEKTGMAPGTLLHIGYREIKDASVQVTQYNSDEIKRSEYKVKLDQIKYDFKDKDFVYWIHFSGIDIAAYENLGKQLDIHNLTLEDALNSHLRPKFEDLDHYSFLSLKLMIPNLEGYAFKSIPVNFILGENYVISFMDSHHPIMNSFLTRLENSTRRIRSKGVDYLFFALADTIVDNYFHLIENWNDKLDELEEFIAKENSELVPRKIENFKKQLMKARRSILPLKEAYDLLIQSESNLFLEENVKFFRDTQDHILFVIDQLDYLRDYLSNIRDTFQSEQNNQLNKTMKLLTLIATIFIPLTFLAGIYGMNFTNMPELEWKYGYFSLLTVMIIVAVGMLLYFKKKKWL